MGVGRMEVGLTSRIVVIDEYIVWAVGKTPKVERNPRHQGHCETGAELRGDKGVRRSGTWSSL